MILRKYLCNPKLLLKTILQQKYIMIVHLLVLFLTTTLPAILTYSSEYIYNRASNVSRYLTEPSGFLVVIIPTAAFFAVYLSFSHLYNKKSAIFTGAFPEKRSCIYFTKYLAACVSSIIPYLIICVINIGFMYYYGYSYSGISFTSALLMVILQYILMVSAITLGASISGNGFAQLVTSAFWFLAVPAFIIVFLTVIDVNFITWSVEYYIDPIYHFPWITIMEDSAWSTGFILFSVAEILVTLLLGCLCYTKRKVENTGNFIAYKKINILVKYYTSIVTAALGSCIVANFENKSAVAAYISCIFFGVIAFCIIQGIFEKSFKSMFSNIKGIILLAVISCAIITVPVMDPLNLDTTIPELKYISIEPFDANLFFHNSFSYNRDCRIITLSSPEILEYSEKMLKDGIKNKLEMDSDYNYQEYSHFTHITIGINRAIAGARAIVVPNDDYSKFVEMVTNSKEYKDAYIKHIESFGENTTARIEKSSLHMYSEIGYERDIEKLKEAIAEDVRNSSYEELSEKPVFCRIHLNDENRSMYLPIYSCYHKTMGLLEDIFNTKLTTSNDFETLRIIQTVSITDQPKEYYVTDSELKQIILDNTGEYTSTYNTNGILYDVLGDDTYLGVIPENLIPKEVFEE